MDKKEVYLNEYNILLDNTAYLPYSTGLLQAYAQNRQKIRQVYNFMPILYHRDHPDKLLASYKNPAVAAFSSAVWNEQLCLAVAKKIKQKFPQCLIVFGGPSAPFCADTYFKKYPFIDVCVRGEGEESFAEILERALETNDFSDIGGISYKNPKTNECVKNADRKIQVDLNVSPSPYIEGVFDQFMNNGFRWQAIMETNRGCPFTCTYCFWGQNGLNRKIRHFNLNRTKREIEWCGKNKITYIFCADGNFGMFEKDEEIASYLAATKKNLGYPERFRVNYSKNTDQRVIKVGSILHKHKLEKSITMSLQSFNQNALNNVKRRNIKMEVFYNLQNQFKEEELNTYTELILGLPGETYESWCEGLETCLSNGINNDIFVYLLQIYPNTVLAELEYQKKFSIKAVRIPLNEGHGASRASDIPLEYECVVTGNYTMLFDDWKKSAVTSWVMQSFISLKLAYFIVLYLVDRFNFKYLDIIKYISDLKSGADSVISKNIEELYELASKINNGMPRTVILKEFGDIYWEPEETFYLWMSGALEQFYNELKITLFKYLDLTKTNYDEQEVNEVVEYQKLRIPRHCLSSEQKQPFTFQYNIPAYFENYFSDNRPKPEKRTTIAFLDNPKDYQSDSKTFAREIILFGRKSNKMLYSVKYEFSKCCVKKRSKDA